MRGGGSGLDTGLSNDVDGMIVGPQVWDAVLTGKYRMIGDYYGGRVTKGEDRTCDIHCIVNMDEHAYLQTGPNMKKGIEAHRKVDFVVSSAQFLNAPAKYSDISCCRSPPTGERPGGLASSNREFLLCSLSGHRAPVRGKRTTRRSYSLIMEKMGIDPRSSTTPHPSEKQQFFNRIAGSKVVVPGTQGKEFQKLVTITDADIKNWGVEGEAQEGVMGLQGHRQRRLPGGAQARRRVQQLHRLC